jgi:2-polyprenyl-3-methyl-5-hydroxy-6-metoxy-1,4-benzoquinol methylase
VADLGACPSCASEDVSFCRPYTADSTPLFEGRQILRCRSCRLGFADPMPTPDALTEYYRSNTWEQDHNRMRHNRSPWRTNVTRADGQATLVARHAGPITSWLDVGAGYGHLLDEARRRGVARTVGVEITPDRVTDLEAKGHETVPGIDAVSGRFDVVSVSHFLEHVPDAVGCLAALRDRLEPGGLLLCEVPNMVRLERPAPDVPHVLFFEAASLEGVMARAGLSLVTAVSCGPMVDPSRDRPRRYVTRMGLRWGSRVPPAVIRRVHPVYVEGPDRIHLRALATA